jgi:hypothetical protein
MRIPERGNLCKQSSPRERNRTMRVGMSCVGSSPVAAYRVEQDQTIAAPERRRTGASRRDQMKESLVTVVIFLALFLSGCTTAAPAAQPGPPGQPGAQGQTGQQGQQGDPGQTGQQGYQGDQGQAGQQGQQGDQGQNGQRGRRGDEGQSGQQGQQGPSAPCPAGQHRYTDPANGEVRCVRD